MRVLITGAGSQVRPALERELMSHGHETLCLTRRQFDIADAAKTSFVDGVDAVVNLAAVADADRCEQAPALAWATNTVGPAILDDLCARRGIPLVCFSSDFVFDGATSDSYTEDDVPAPLNVYGRTKAAQDATVSHGWTLRTSWVLGPRFAAHLRRQAVDHGEIRIVEPVSTARAVTDRALARTVRWFLGERPDFGLFNVTCPGRAVRTEVVAAFASVIGVDVPVVTVPTVQGRAVRPCWSPLSTKKLEAAGWQIPHLDEVLACW